MTPIQHNQMTLTCRTLLGSALLVSATTIAHAGTEDAKLVSSDGAAGDQFGRSVSVSGNSAVISSYGDDDNGSFSGSAYVFVHNGTGWSQQAKLKPNDGAASDLFGNSVAMSGDRVIVGSPLDDDNGNLSGSAYIFKRTGSSWSQEGKLLANDGAAGDSFGTSVSISGNTAIVGSHDSDGSGSGSGAAYIFVRNGSSWTQQAKLTASDAASGDSFGYSVDIDGERALVGAYANDDGGVNSGSAYVFRRNGTNWSQEDKLLANDRAANDLFGNSVSISGDLVVVGSPENDDDGNSSGSAYAFVRNGSSWNQQAKLTANDAGASQYLGYSVAVQGETIITSAHGHSGQGVLSGAGYVFQRTGGNWSQSEKLIASDGSLLDSFSFGVALDQEHALLGAFGDDDHGGDSGSAYSFTLEEVSTEPGNSFCFGDGSGTNCPCGAAGAPGQGCPNTNANRKGALLTCSGEASFSNDNIGFTVEDAAPSKPGLLMLGSSAIAYPNGSGTVPNSSGILCLNPSLRGEVVFTDATGGANLRDFRGEPFGMTAESSGRTTFYQYWFRDPGNSCQNSPGNGAAFNFSNGYELVWSN